MKKYKIGLEIRREGYRGQYCASDCPFNPRGAAGNNACMLFREYISVKRFSNRGVYQQVPCNECDVAILRLEGKK